MIVRIHLSNDGEYGMGIQVFLHILTLIISPIFKFFTLEAFKATQQSITGMKSIRPKLTPREKSILYSFENIREEKRRWKDKNTSKDAHRSGAMFTKLTWPCQSSTYHKQMPNEDEGNFQQWKNHLRLLSIRFWANSTLISPILI